MVKRMVNFEFGEEIEKDFFVLSQACDKSKKKLSPHVESNLKPQTFRFTAQILKSFK